MKTLGTLLAAGLVALAPMAAWSQQPPVKIVDIVELSGDGKVAGTRFNDGVLLAVKEINAAGGILGRKLEVQTFDTQSKPELASAFARQAAAADTYAVMGPVFSGSILESMKETQRAEIPNFIGGEADEITAQGNPYVFRTSLRQSDSMPKLARYMRQGLRAKTAAMVWVDSAFGRGGHEAMSKALAAEGIKLVADIVTQQRQGDFADAAAKVKAANADATFVYLTEDESADFLRALRRQDYQRWVVGETTLIGQSVLTRAGEAANGIRGHVGLTPHALSPVIRAFDNAFLREYGYRSDHNGMKGYTAMYVLKAVTEKIGSFDRKAFAAAMKNLTLSAKDHPGVLIDVKYDDKGDLARTSYIVRISGGRHEFIATLPAGSAAQP